MMDISILWWLIIGHAAADYGIQTEYVATMRNRKHAAWVYPLTAHALIHGGVVAFITGSIILGLAETIAHWCIDFGKCEGWFGIHSDQGMHVGCKVMWFALA